MAEERRGTLAVLALVFGIVGLGISWVPVINSLGFASSIAAIILGTIGLTQISKGTSLASGRRLSISGMVLGAIGLVTGVLFAVVLQVNL